MLVNREDEFAFAVSFLWVMNGSRAPSQVIQPLKKLERRGIETLIRIFEATETFTRVVKVSGMDTHANHVLVALGANGLQTQCQI